MEPNRIVKLSGKQKEALKKAFKEESKANYKNLNIFIEYMKGTTLVVLEYEQNEIKCYDKI